VGSNRKRIDCGYYVGNSISTRKVALIASEQVSHPELVQPELVGMDTIDAGDFKGLHSGTGVYRIRMAASPVLAYIGQAGRDLRQRLGDLRRNTAAEQMPFNDSHTAAPSLWAWNDAEGYRPG
jgi:hypothetical protein